MTKIHLYGELGQKYGNEYDLAIDSVPEGVRALCFLKEGFLNDLQKWDYQIFVGDPDSPDAEELDENTLGLHTNRDIHIYPVVDGASKGLGKIIVSALLITASFFILPYSPLAASAVFNLGVAIGLQGVSLLLAPQIDKAGAPTIFNNDPLETQQGTPIPVLYGTMFFECQPISTSVTAGLQGLSVATDSVSPTALGNDGISIYNTLDGWNLYQRDPDF